MESANEAVQMRPSRIELRKQQEQARRVAVIAALRRALAHGMREPVAGLSPVEARNRVTCLKQLHDLLTSFMQNPAKSDAGFLGLLPYSTMRFKHQDLQMIGDFLALSENEVLQMASEVMNPIPSWVLRLHPQYN